MIGYTCTHFSGHAEHEDLRSHVPLPVSLVDSILRAMSTGASNEEILRCLNASTTECPAGIAPHVTMSQLL